jgi:hypothetical protein
MKPHNANIKNLPSLAVYRMDPRERFQWERVKADYAKDRQIFKYNPDESDTPQAAPDPFSRLDPAEAESEGNFDQFASIDNFDNFSDTLQARLDSLQAEHTKYLAEEQRHTQILKTGLDATAGARSELKEIQKNISETAALTKKSKETSKSLENEITKEWNLNDEYRVL